MSRPGLKPNQPLLQMIPGFFSGGEVDCGLKLTIHIRLVPRCFFDLDSYTHAFTFYIICNRLDILTCPVKWNDKYDKLRNALKFYKASGATLLEILSSVDLNVVLTVCYKFGLSDKNATYSIPVQWDRLHICRRWVARCRPVRRLRWIWRFCHHPGPEMEFNMLKKW
jgi:hypothetical protein